MENAIPYGYVNDVFCAQNTKDEHSTCPGDSGKLIEINYAFCILKCSNPFKIKQILGCLKVHVAGYCLAPLGRPWEQKLERCSKKFVYLLTI